MSHGIFFIQDLALALATAAVVGWICQRVGLSVIAGYLLAGMLISLHPLAGPLLADPARIGRLQLAGLVFLMFGLGLRLSVRRLRRLGASVTLATVAGAGTVYYVTRTVATGVFGLGEMEGLFLAGMLMVSSTAVISRVMEETGGVHERAGQTALGVVALEDVIGVVFVAALNMVAKTGGAHISHIGGALGTLTVSVLMAGVAGLLFVPWVLRKLGALAGGELQTVAVGGMLLGVALLSFEAGYSLTLGAFLLGMIVAGTPQRAQVERSYEGLTGIFSAVFFVAIGLRVVPVSLVASWKMIAAVAALALVTRPLAVSFGLMLTGTPMRNSFQVGLMVAPVGEFSFIMAHCGVVAAVVPGEFYPVAVGVSLLTMLCAPALARNAAGISRRIIGRLPRWMITWHAYYGAQLDSLGMRRKRNRLWQLSRKRLVQIGVEALLATGVLVFSRPLLAWMEGWLGDDWLFPGAANVIFWLAITVVVLAPLVALWRNVSALSLLYAQVLVPRTAAGVSPRLRVVMEMMFKIVAATVIFLWLFTLLPSMPGTRWLLLVSVGVAAALLWLLRRKLIYWHSEMESELQAALNNPARAGVETAAPWLQSHRDWGIRVASCMLPDLAECQGRRISELDLRAQHGCLIAGIERQGVLIQRPGPEVVLYPRDKVLLIGTGEQVAAGKKILTAVSGRAHTAEFDDVRMDTLDVPAGSRADGRDLRTLALAQAHRVQIAGIRRGERRILNPGGHEVLMAGDELLVTGSPDEMRMFADWLMDTAEQAGEGGEGRAGGGAQGAQNERGGKGGRGV